MQFFQIVIFSCLIATIYACAPTQTVVSPPTTTPTGRKRRSIDENKSVVIKVIFNISNQIKAHQLEELIFDKLYTSAPTLSLNLDKSRRFTTVENNDLNTIITISDSLAFCSKIMTSIKNILEKNIIIKDVLIKCGDNKYDSVFTDL
uniref:Germane domain-containing protein n=1 Tax=Strongyloides stercoralis TaxID=6248 RepID=A0A0K0EB09_STRER